MVSYICRLGGRRNDDAFAVFCCPFTSFRTEPGNREQGTGNDAISSSVIFLPFSVSCFPFTSFMDHGFRHHCAGSEVGLLGDEGNFPGGFASHPPSPFRRCQGRSTRRACPQANGGGSDPAASPLGTKGEERGGK